MSLTDSIPNNVDLASDPKLLRALEKWQPSFLQWWRDMGPDGFQEDLIWLRTAVSVDPDGWAHYDYVKMPDYRWGIFLTPQKGGGMIKFGDQQGKPTWDQVPGELRGYLTVVPESRWLKHPRHLKFFLTETTSHYEAHAADLAAILAGAGR